MASRKEKISPPTKRATSDGSKELKKGSPAGGRVMADKSVAVRQGVVPGVRKKR